MAPELRQLMRQHWHASLFVKMFHFLLDGQSLFNTRCAFTPVDRGKTKRKTGHRVHLFLARFATIGCWLVMDFLRHIVDIFAWTLCTFFPLSMTASITVLLKAVNLSVHSLFYRNENTAVKNPYVYVVCLFQGEVVKNVSF